MNKSKFENKKEWQKFGIGLGIVLLIIGTIQFILNKELYFYFYGMAILIFLSVAFVPVFLKPIFILFSYIGFKINWVTTRVTLNLFFFLVFIPIGFFLKLVNKNPLDLKINKAENSYWLKRKVTKFKKSDFESQF